VSRALPFAPLPRQVKTAKSASRVFAVWLAASLAPLVGLASLAGCATPDLSQAPEISHTVSFNTHAYDDLSLKELRGKVVMLFFWSVGDIGCRRAAARVDRLRDRFRPQGLEVVGIHSPVWESVEKPAHYVFEKLQECGVTFPVVLDSDNRIKTAYGSLIVPSLVLVDRNGRIRAEYAGTLDYASVETTLKQLLMEDGRPAAERLFVPTVEPTEEKRFRFYEEGP